MSKEQALQDVADEMFSAMIAALMLAPPSCGAYGVLDKAIKSIQPRWLLREALDHDRISMES